MKTFLHNIHYETFLCSKRTLNHLFLQFKKSTFHLLTIFMKTRNFHIDAYTGPQRTHCKAHSNPRTQTKQHIRPRMCPRVCGRDTCARETKLLKKVGGKGIVVAGRAIQQINTSGGDR